MLVSNPKQRINIDQLIEHPYFESVVSELPDATVSYLQNQRNER